MMRPAISVPVVGMLFACASADVLLLDPTPRPVRAVDSVAVLLDEPERPYQAIALIEVSDDSWGLSLESLANKMREEAAKLGADAVIIAIQSTESGAILVPIGNMWYAANTEEKKLVGKAIVFSGRTR